ncbi:RNA polymerase, sigma 54 subunit, RpoN/SigL [Tistlia consotensis]|uniref:RNA polymerase sigma-54 factor n=1 Tax=Tistlia consotensis USBA 355 TaxID=560819 RepID=A0A1Y6B5C3_9PROT|nr:RNA polymerase factor sigma-54 [Tistlia consotensis]SME93168.1 RNA polymerase, sigma 54 subunit, RpoN/SigL [Tistlia consotensis USBA 355]SNR28452.1 RNA polymerase, sigma 54 subunit, RpoN/SigL [Tistlia consotensis]
MAVSQRLELRQSQSLVMTPQLQQAIRLLQLSNLELADYVERELEQNPLLDRADPEPSGFADEMPPEPDAFRPQDSADYASADRLPAAGESPLDRTEVYDDNSPSDDWPAGGEGSEGGSDSWGAGGEGAFNWGSGRGGRFEDDEDAGFEQRLADRPRLRDLLLEQVQMDLETPADRLIGAYLVDCLDEAGYLSAPLDELAGQLGCGEAELTRVLARLQRFEPTGVFARDLKECLALQLAERNRLDPLMARLLDNLPLVAERDYAKLRRVVGCDAEDLSDMLSELRRLDPRPALTYEGGAAEPIVPDVLLRARPDGSWLVELNADTLPRVLVDQGTYARVVRHCRTRQDKDYVSEQLQAANWLVKALHQRAGTILKVATELVRQQDAFFRKGVRHLKPMTLKDIAEEIGMHESTVSRVTSNKFLATPRGTYELKYFFSAALGGAGGEEHAAEAVRDRIKTLIAAEAPQAVLSDDAIVDKLKAEGIEIARRTVAKYREALNIPSSVQRRREKALALAR